MEVILSNSVVSLQVFAANILWVKNSLNLIVTNVISAKIVDKHNCLNEQMTKGEVTGQALFARRECSLQSTHPPLTCLMQRGVNIQNEE